MSCGIYLLFRRLGYVSIAALAGAVSYSYSGYFIRKLMFVNYIQGIAWLPWLLLVITPKKETSYSRISIVIHGSILLGLICLAGHPQVVLFGLSVLWMYGMFGPISMSWKLRCFLTIVISIFGLLLGSWQLLPTAEVNDAIRKKQS